MPLRQFNRETREDARSEEHTSELQSPCNLVCRLLLEKTKADEFAARAADPTVQMSDLVSQWKLGGLARDLHAWSLVMTHHCMRLCDRVSTDLRRPSDA